MKIVVPGRAGTVRPTGHYWAFPFTCRSETKPVTRKGGHVRGILAIGISFLFILTGCDPVTRIIISNDTGRTITITLNDVTKTIEPGENMKFGIIGLNPPAAKEEHIRNALRHGLEKVTIAFNDSESVVGVEVLSRILINRSSYDEGTYRVNASDIVSALQ